MPDKIFYLCHLDDPSASMRREGEIFNRLLIALDWYKRFLSLPASWRIGVEMKTVN